MVSKGEANENEKEMFLVCLEIDRSAAILFYLLFINKMATYEPAIS